MKLGAPAAGLHARPPAGPNASVTAVTDRRFADFVTLTKPRLNLLVLLTTLAGLYLASPQGVEFTLLLNTLVGTAIVAGGAAALNQVWEHRTDALMRRTRVRPLPAGRLGVAEGTWFGVLLSLVGLAQLAIGVNLTAAAVALATLVSYVLVYTPLKPLTSLSTVVGALPGALPPVIGWAAARGSLDAGAFVLFAILFLWQIPHFLAIAWIYREDYARGGLPMLPVLDPDGKVTGRQAVANSLALLLVSLTPRAAGLAGNVYLVGAVVLGMAFTAVAFRAAIERTAPAARRLFVASIVYLALLCALLIADKV